MTRSWSQNAYHLSSFVQHRSELAKHREPEFTFKSRNIPPVLSFDVLEALPQVSSGRIPKADDPWLSLLRSRFVDVQSPRRR